MLKVLNSCLVLTVATHLRQGEVSSPPTLESEVDDLDRFIKGVPETTHAPSMPAVDDSSTLSISTLLASAKWPEKDSYDDVFRKVISGAAGQACSAPLLARSRLSPYGLGAHLNQFANEVELAMYSGQPLALCAPANVRDAWEKYFNDPGFSKCGECDWGSGPRQYREMGWDVSDSSDHTHMVDVKRYVYGKLFGLKYDVQETVNTGLSALGLPSSYVGVHVRRGDKSQEVPLVPIERFASAIQEMSSSLGTTTIFLASDDAATHSSLQQLLGSSYKIIEQARLPAEAYKLRGDAARSMEPTYGVEDEEKSVLTDVSALVNAAGFIGTASSNIDRLVYFQRDASKPTLSLDEGGNDGFITLAR